MSASSADGRVRGSPLALIRSGFQRPRIDACDFLQHLAERPARLEQFVRNALDVLRRSALSSLNDKRRQLLFGCLRSLHPWTKEGFVSLTHVQVVSKCCRARNVKRHQNATYVDKSAKIHEFSRL